MCLPVSVGLIDFNPRSPWGERLQFSGLNFTACRFQSTLPVGGATVSPFSLEIGDSISIHAPRGGSDLSGLMHSIVGLQFQSTLPVGGATD